MRVWKKAHVEYEIRIHRDAVLESEAHDVTARRPLAPLTSPDENATS